MQSQNTRLPQTKQQQNHRALFLGLLVWFVYQNLINSLTSVACEWHWLTIPVGGLESLQFVEMLIALVALVIMGYLLFLGWRNWRALQTKEPLQNPHMLRDTEQDRGALLAFISMMLNGFFLLFILATVVPMFSFMACGQA